MRLCGEERAIIETRTDYSGRSKAGRSPSTHCVGNRGSDWKRHANVSHCAC